MPYLSRLSYFCCLSSSHISLYVFVLFLSFLYDTHLTPHSSSALEFFIPPLFSPLRSFSFRTFVLLLTSHSFGVRKLSFPFCILSFILSTLFSWPSSLINKADCFLFYSLHLSVHSCPLFPLHLSLYPLYPPIYSPIS